MQAAAQSKSEPSLSSFAAVNVPRYTSYPTAPNFSPAIDARRYAGWLSALPAEATLSLYLHVPFCAELCLYCGCNTKAVRRREPVDRYIESLVREIELTASHLVPRKVTHLHWGGGTPSMLGEDGFQIVMDRLARAFDLSAIREHAIEIDPRHANPSLASFLGRIGVNRASFGVQDFSAEVQREIGRIQPFDVVKRCIDMFVEAGILGINIDLMYGLPRQSAAVVARNADLAASLQPGRIALFGYAHVPWMKKSQRLIDARLLPGHQERLAQARVAARVLTGHGYRAIGFDHFADPRDELAIAARTGRLRRNFQGYTADQADALIGFGASAIGRMPSGYVQNAPDIAGYARALSGGRLPVVRGVELTADDRLRGRIIERLLCDFAVDLDALAPGADFQQEMSRLTPLAEAGFIAIDGGRISILEPGRNFARLAAAAFDAYLSDNRSRHSLAV
ncbi:MAG: oxygen-independent coproporphyrinogen III oxidase [Pseudomonadota bacterium]